MALTLFSRTRTAPEHTPQSWPEIGETWKPEGVTIVERYYNLAHAVVLVYSTDSDGYYHSIACLGCHYLVTRDNNRNRTYADRLKLSDAAELANAHASTCRALPRKIPARPDEDAARHLFREWVLGIPRRDEDRYLSLADFDSGRLELQRSNEWMYAELDALAAERGDVLSAKPSEYSPSIEYKILRSPS
ncbi:hypothetical protein ACH4PU_32190 [Streptomyces sp. NPDC021100]|uniref:hypothetical protein n=1 Tax=Streptomyces sp. NPDC021100 TaxID=3365114 RepID=UPI0037A53D38